MKNERSGYNRKGEARNRIQILKDIPSGKEVIYFTLLHWSIFSKPGSRSQSRSLLKYMFLVLGDLSAFKYFGRCSGKTSALTSTAELR